MYLRLIFTCFFLHLAIAKVLQVRDDECLIQGLQCNANCSAVVYCLAQGGQEVLLDDCGSKGENCATIDGQVQCSKVESDCHSIAPENPFQCVQSGPFPDPLNCSLSYTCQSSSPDPVVKCECEKGYFWDTRYSQCSNDPQGLSDCCISLDSRPKCDQQYDGNFGPCHPGYYYVCSLQPDGQFQVVVLRCEPNTIYNPITHTCEPPRNDYGLGKTAKKNDIGTKTDARCSAITTSTSTSTTPIPETTTTKCFKVSKKTVISDWPDDDFTTTTESDTTTTTEAGTTTVCF